MALVSPTKAHPNFVAAVTWERVALNLGSSCLSFLSARTVACTTKLALEIFSIAQHFQNEGNRDVDFFNTGPFSTAQHDGCTGLTQVRTTEKAHAYFKSTEGTPGRNQTHVTVKPSKTSHHHALVPRRSAHTYASRSNLICKHSLQNLYFKDVA